MFQIFLKNKKTHTIIVTNDTTIKDIKNFILNTLHIPSRCYYLINGGSILDNKNTLKDYSINEGTTIEIVIRAV